MLSAAVSVSVTAKPSRRTEADSDEYVSFSLGIPT
jgi:guanylate kinase